MFKSWAVTKGPSLDPKDKRLAVETEDHPLDYGDFEGTIPKGEYGGGTVMLWDRGFWATDVDPNKALRKGELRFTLAGEKLQGSWVLVRLRHDRERGKRTNWLLIKRHDGYERDNDEDKLLSQDRSVASKRSMEEIATGKGRSPKPFMRGKKNNFKANAIWHSSRKDGQGAAAEKSVPARLRTPARTTRKAAISMPSFIPPQLCKRVGRPPSGQDWVHEIKLDGYRMQLRIEDGAPVMRTRKGLDWTAKFAAVADAGRRLPDCIIDGEVVALDHNGVPNFASLQAALSEGRSADLTYFVFDLPFVDGEDLRKLPLVDRKQRLKAMLRRKGPHTSRLNMSSISRSPAMPSSNQPASSILKASSPSVRSRLTGPAALRVGTRPSAAVARRW